MRQNELEQLNKVLDQEYLAEQTLFNKLLNRDKSISVDQTFLFSWRSGVLLSFHDEHL